MYNLLGLTIATLIAVPWLNAPAHARSMGTGDAAIVEQSTPAVVSIAVWKVRQPDKAGDPPRRVKAYGSGFVVDPTGIIVTNKHVVDGGIDFTAIFADGSEARAKVAGVAAMIDLAVLKIDVGHPLPALKWGNSNELKVGDPVLTIGNPLGLGMSVSTGIVSALNRDLQDTPFDSYIQTDSAINHGNSGGPMIDHDGNVIGVDTALYNPDAQGGFIGIGFAIPSETAKFVVDHMLDPNQPKPGWLGITLQDLSSELSKALATPQAKGAIVSKVDQGGPANRASLRPGDVLLGISDVQPADARAYMREIAMIQPGQTAKLTVWRDGKEHSVTATVGEWPNLMPGGGVMQASAAKEMMQKMPDPGVRLGTITDEARTKYGIDPTVSGALVATVEPDCEARDLGMVPGDVITAVQGNPVATPDDVRNALKTAIEQHRPFMAVLIQGKTGTRWLTLSLGNSTS